MSTGLFKNSKALIFIVDFHSDLHQTQVFTTLIMYMLSRV